METRPSGSVLALAARPAGGRPSISARSSSGASGTRWTRRRRGITSGTGTKPDFSGSESCKTPRGDDPAASPRPGAEGGNSGSTRTGLPGGRRSTTMSTFSTFSSAGGWALGSGSISIGSAGTSTGGRCRARSTMSGPPSTSSGGAVNRAGSFWWSGSGPGGASGGSGVCGLSLAAIGTGARPSSFTAFGSATSAKLSSGERKVPRKFARVARVATVIFRHPSWIRGAAPSST